MNDKYGSTKLVAICVGGIIFNLVVSNIVQTFGSPLYLDTGGTIFIAALGGFTPGITVGFLTNVITSIITNVVKFFTDGSDAMISLGPLWKSLRGHVCSFWEEPRLRMPSR